MARKTIGFVELEWVCPNCHTKNPGKHKTCTGCGSPMPENITFQRAQEEKLLAKDSVTPEEKLPDIHCGYCGTRNPAKAKTCSQCNADLTAGKQREGGKVLGEFISNSGPVEIECLHCGSLNPGSYQYCSKCGGNLASPSASPPSETRKPPIIYRTAVILGVIGFIIVCGIVFALTSNLFKKDTITASVDEVFWQRTITVEEYIPVTHKSWKDEIPGSATLGVCEKRYFTTLDHPVPASTEVCGTPYVVDQGSGLGEVAQDCQYEVYQDYCEFSVVEWAVVNQLSLDGYDNQPIWPEPSLSSGQRLGPGEESFRIQFRDGQNEYQYQTDDLTLFEQAIPGSQWELTINGLGTVIAVEPQ